MRDARLLIAWFPDSATARLFMMEHRAEVVHRAVSLVDHSVDRAIRVKPAI
jgi:hypothetical protein